MASPAFAVLLTEGAEQDLELIHDTICEYDCVANAHRMLDGLADVLDTLSRFPERGSWPKELLGLGIREYRQIFFTPYRVIYRVVGQQVIVYVVADGRRDMQTLLDLAVALNALDQNFPRLLRPVNRLSFAFPPCIENYKRISRSAALVWTNWNPRPMRGSVPEPYKFGEQVSHLVRED
jgi:toxin ParE1/3/4